MGKDGGEGVDECLGYKECLMVEDHRRSFPSPSAPAALLYVRDGWGGLS
jgi:hypothetical protein